jgi:general secretion pathway protein D
MRNLTHLFIPCMLIALALLSGCSGGLNAFSKAEKFEAEGKYEEAMYSYAEAFRKNPESTTYRARFLEARDAAADQRYKRGVEQYKKGNYVDALTDFQAGYGFDPSQPRFKQQIDLTNRLKDALFAFEEGVDFEKANKLKDASRCFARAMELHPDNKEYQDALGRVLEMRKSKLAGYDLNLKSAKPITLKFKDAKLKEVFSILTRLSGINFVFDDGVKDQNITIYLENATFQQSLELLTSMNKLGRKILNESTVIIYPKGPDKIKQYEEMEMRTFHLNYLEAKKAVNLVRGMIQVRKLQVNDDSNSIIVRDTKDVVDVVEKILDASDVPDAEVVLDVEVLEITDNNAENVGLLLSNYNVQMALFKGPNQMASSLSAVTNTVPTGSTVTGTTTAGPSNLAQIFKGNGVAGFMTVPSGQYNFQKTLAKGEVLSNPKIRIKNKEKSKFNVGTRVPITTTTLNGTISQVNVQYVDVGVKINAEPTIQLNNDVVIKLGLEVSSILSTEKVGGADSATQVVTIGTRNLDTVLSLRDGETSIIGGLISRTNSSSKTKISFLGDLPLIGPLISNNNDSKQKSELVLAITPRLIRRVTVPQMENSAFMSGKEDEPTLVRPLAAFEEEAVFEGDKKQTSLQAEKTAKDSKTALGASQRSGGPATSIQTPPTASSPITPAETVASTPVTPAEPTTTEAPAKSKTPWNPDKGMLEMVVPPNITVGQQIGIDIKVSYANDLKKAQFILTYDPGKLDFVSIAEGPFFKNDGKETTFSGKANPSGGTVTVVLSRNDKDKGVSGTGIVASAVFKVKEKGTASFAFTAINFIAAENKPYQMVPFDRTINVSP